MIKLNDDLYRLDHIDLEAVATVVIQQEEPESLITSRQLAALATFCQHVAGRSNRAKRSLLMEFAEEAERVGLKRTA